METTAANNFSNAILTEIHSLFSGMRRNTKWKRFITNNLQSNGILPVIPTTGGPSSPLKSSSPSASISKEELILFSFNKLKQTLEQCRQVSDLNAPDIVDPFLLVITFPDTTGLITGYSLASIDRLIRLGMLEQCSFYFEAICNIIHSVTHCKFEATDSASDEVVLLRILEILRLCLHSKCSRRISDELICGLIECAFSVCFQMRLSQCLRKSAEILIGDCVCCLVEGLSSIVDETLAETIPSHDTQLDTTDKDTTATAPQIHNTSEIATTPMVSRLENASPRSPSNSGEEEFIHIGKKSSSNNELVSKTHLSSNQHSPYGLPSLREFIRFTSSILDPFDQRNTDSMRLIALNIIQILVENGHSLIITNTALVDAFSHLLTNLIQLIRTSQTNANLTLLNPAIQLANIVFNLMRSQFPSLYEYYLEEILINSLWDDVLYVFQKSDDFSSIDYEKFLRVSQKVLKSAPQDSRKSFILDSLFSRKKTIPYRVQNKFSYVTEEASQVYWESIFQIMRNEDFVYSSFVNFDCQVSSNNILQDIVFLLCNNLLNKNLNHDVIFELNFTDSENIALYEEQHSLLQQQRIFSLGVTIALDLITLMLSRLLNRVSTHGYELQSAATTPNPSESTEPLIAKLRRKLSRKSALLRVSKSFQKSPEEAIQTMVSEGLIPSEKPEHIGAILHEIPKLDKRKLGEYLGKPKAVEVLYEFFKVFDWQVNTRIDEALRIVLSKFRLPGEAQQIQRVVEAFASSYFNKVVLKRTQKRHSFSPDSKEQDIQTPDAVFTLAYSIIMLNTDQHNPQVRKRMAKQDFVRNLRGTNDGSDFFHDYLGEIFDAIKSNEIVMLEERADEFLVYILKDQQFHGAKGVALSRHAHDEKAVISIDIELFESYYEFISLCVLYNIEICNSQNDAILNKCLTIYYQLCNLAYFYGLKNALSNLLKSLFAINPLSMTRDPLRPQNGDLSRSSSQLGLNDSGYATINAMRSVRCQMINIILFRILNEFGNLISDSAIWKSAFDVLFQFLNANLITFHTFDYYFYRKIIFPKILVPNMNAIQESRQAAEPNHNGSIFSAISSFLLSSSYSAVPQQSPVQRPILISEELVEYELVSNESIRSTLDECKIDQLLKQNIRNFDLESIISAILQSDTISPNESVDSVTVTMGHNQTLFAILMSLKLVKATSNFELAESFIRRMSIIFNNLENYHFIVVKYAFYSILDLLCHSCSYTAQCGNTAAEPSSESSAISAVNAVLCAINSIRQASFEAKYAYHGLYNINLFDALIPYILNGLFYSINQLNSLLNQSDTDKDIFGIFKEMCRISKIVITKISSFDRDTNLLRKASEIARDIWPTLSFTDSMELINYFLQQYCQIFLIRNETITASQIASKLSSPPLTPPTSTEQKDAPFATVFREWALKCCEHISKMVDNIEENPEPVDTWNEKWVPILHTLCELTCHNCREVRSLSMSILQKTCLTPKISPHVYESFTQVLFPFFIHSKERDVDASVASSTESLAFTHQSEELQLRSSVLLCKLFLHYSHTLPSNQREEIWMGLLETLKDIYLNANRILKERMTNGSNEIRRQSEMSEIFSLIESIPESIKNMILVMNTSGMFDISTVAADSSTVSISVETWKQLESWLPNLKEELFPSTQS